VQDITPDDNFIVLACDGLYDVFTNDEVIQFVKAFMDRSGDSQKCCQALSYEAIKKRGAKDNVSVILVILNKWWL
jgi:serine/threonine protein phosphatase PrpC